jgi:hypothetical protein
VVNKSISASVPDAIKDVLTLSKYGDLTAKLAFTLYNDFSKGNTVNVDEDTSQYEKLIDKLFRLDFIDLDVNYLNADRYFLTERGKAFIHAVDGRIETLKGKKYGYDLFEK